MSTQLPDPVADIVMDLGASVDRDIPRLQPPDEEHFDPFSVAVAFGGVLLVAYLKGFAEEAKGSAETLGHETAAWLRSRIASLFDSASDEDRVSAATTEVREEVSRALAAAPLDPVATAQAAEAASDSLRILLIAEFAFPASRAGQVAQEVNEKGVRLMTCMRPANAATTSGAVPGT